MDGETTSRGGFGRFVPRMWREWARFVARPRLPERREAFGAKALGEVGQLWALDLAVNLVLVVGLSWLATRLGVKTPEFEQLTRYGPLFTLAVGALGLPILEECVFRGWLTGSRQLLVLVGIALAALASLLALNMVTGAPLYIAIAVVLGGWLAVGLWLAWRIQGGAPAWFARAFPSLFYLSTLAFALAHMTNYDLARPWILVPFVVPQLIAGSIFGFARVRYGMWANVTLHTTSNALFLGLSLSGL